MRIKNLFFSQPTPIYSPIYIILCCTRTRAYKKKGIYPRPYMITCKISKFRNFRKILIKSTTTAARFTISWAFFALFARRRIHFTWIITYGFFAAIGTNHLIRINFHQFFKTFAALRTFILQKGHGAFSFIHFLRNFHLWYKIFVHHEHYTPMPSFLQPFLSV